jgi:hypothetical protein
MIISYPIEWTYHLQNDARGLASRYTESLGEEIAGFTFNEVYPPETNRNWMFG